MAEDNRTRPPAEVLPYEPTPAPPRGLHVCEHDGHVVVQFPAAPEWVWVALVSLQLAVGLMKAGTSAAIALTLHRVASAGPAPSPELAQQIRKVELSVLGGGVLGAGFWWAAALYTVWAYRHGAGRPRTLSADRRSLVLSKFRWLKRGELVWAVSDIAGLDLHKIRGNLNWRRTVADLYVRPYRGRRKRFRLSSGDPLLPEQIAQRLSTALGVPLSHR